MRFLIRAAISLVALVAILFVAGYALPRHQVVERSVTIAAPPEAIFGHVSSLQAFTEWSPWSGIDPDMQVDFSGPDTGVGNRMVWTSDHPDVGNGVQEIVELVENESVRTTLDFGDMGGGEAWWRLVPEGEATRVVWGLDADMGSNPVGRWFGLMMDGFVGPDYERGLSQLQTLVES